MSGKGGGGRSAGRCEGEIVGAESTGRRLDRAAAQELARVHSDGRLGMRGLGCRNRPAAIVTARADAIDAALL